MHWRVRDICISHANVRFVSEFKNGWISCAKHMHASAGGGYLYFSKVHTCVLYPNSQTVGYRARIFKVNLTMQQISSCHLIPNIHPIQHQPVIVHIAKAHPEQISRVHTPHLALTLVAGRRIKPILKSSARKSSATESGVTRKCARLLSQAVLSLWALNQPRV